MDQPTTALKFCINCAHFRDRLCLASQNWNGIDLVTGERKRLMEFAENAREATHACGTLARWFVQKSSPAADLREAPLTEGDRGNRKGHGVQIRQPGGDTTQGRE